MKDFCVLDPKLITMLCSSLRSQIGIVPQTPILFDDTVMNNVRYAKLHATDDEVYRACQAACIHEQILGFSEGRYCFQGGRNSLTCC